MPADWRRLSRAAGLRSSGDSIEVSFGDGRRQTVFTDASENEVLRLWSVVARASALSVLKTPVLDAWHRNRMSELVGFSLDRHGRMIGESWVPVAGLSAEEWGHYVRRLAMACDRFEYLLTGKDEA